MKPCIFNEVAQATLSAETSAIGRASSRLATGTGLALAILGLMMAQPGGSHAGTLLFKSPNTAVYFGLSVSQLEFENPLSGTEAVLGHPVLQWLDADYAPGPPPWYDDWTVNSAGGTIDGHPTEVWMRAAGQSVTTAATKAGTILSIHLNGDSNDGIAQVLVDGLEVARLDMYYGGPGAQTVLVLVRGLANAMHQVAVNALGPGQSGGPDVAVLGAAVLGESDLKWQQPPVPTQPTNVFYGWNELSMHNPPALAVADDWVCTTAQPVTRIRWWGSFLGWTQTELPPGMPLNFRLTFWTDVPAPPPPQPGFSHPGIAVHQVVCSNYRAHFAGWDFDPRAGSYEACFVFEQDLAPHEWFYQEPGPTGTNVYWLSITAGYTPPLVGPPWGWKTRPRDPKSAAPDDAVVIMAPPASEIQPGVPFLDGHPIFWPTEQDSWDMAFELFSQAGSVETKWLQVPDLSPQGIDVNATFYPELPPPYLLADDFLCTSTGPITNISIWGSWRHDKFPEQNPGLVAFTLSIHDDIPANQSPTGYSMPGRTVWFTNLFPGQFSFTPVPLQGDFEGWWTPPDPALYELPGDKNCFRYDFPIPPGNLIQEGTPARPKVYWLNVQARPMVPPVGPEPAWFGWKSCPTNWNDDAVWVHGIEPLPPGLIWSELRYPPPHPRAQQSLNLAFRVSGPAESGGETRKWSQPPVGYAATNGFNGWNEPSIYASSHIVADDWVCADRRPVSDVHFWGSFLGWVVPIPPESTIELPRAFTLTIWTDVPPAPGGLPWSHPGTALWQHQTTNFAMEFAGWDWDPRKPSPTPEACFKFHVDLLPEDWFYQDPGARTNIYWLSVAAVYPSGSPGQFPWGWKTRPRDLASPAPDDAVVIISPTAPSIGSVFQQGYPLEFPTAVSWDMAFELTAGPENPDLDWGDAPDPLYPTLLANNGARHVIGPMWMGARVDAEPDGQPHPAALGDDLNPPLGVDDEDGVQFGAALIGGVPNTVTVTTSIGGFLQAWIDLNGDGDWADANEQVIKDRAVGPGPNQVNFLVPNLPGGPVRTFMRFRLSGLQGLGFAGLAPDGEVEDYEVKLELLKWLQRPELGWEGVDVDNFWVQLADDFRCTQTGPITDIHLWGSFFKDLLPEGGPGNMNFTLFLYSDVPAGPNNLYSHPGDLLWQKSFGPGQFVPGHCFFQPDGEWWHDPASRLWQANADKNIYQFDFYLDPADAFSQVEGTIYWLGVKYKTEPNPSFSFGWKTTYEHWNDDACWLDSSVPVPVWRELRYGDGHPWAQRPDNSIDFAFAISGQRGEAWDFGDAPEGAAAPLYPTRMINNGARHVIVPGLSLGNRLDAEPDGQPTGNALGDDLAGIDDEEGVTLPLLPPGKTVTITVNVTGSGVLNAWLDFGNDGSWATPGDQIIANAAVVTGVYNFSVAVPATTPWSAITFARFRLSTVANLSFTGPAPDGEVEDYAVRTVDLPVHELGDAPDSSNGSGAVMTAYPSGGPPGVLATFPTVYGGVGGLPPFGPIHMQPRAVAWLGANVTTEWEADSNWDQDVVNNIDPLADRPDQDGADDGISFPVTLAHGVNNILGYTVTAPAPPPVPLFLNVWFDWNRDGDWNDAMPCPDGVPAPEWAVQNQPVPLPGPGTFNLVSPPFRAWHPSVNRQPVWMRVTLSEQQWQPANAGGAGPAGGYLYGETEDYYVTEYKSNTDLDFGDAPDPGFPTLLPNGARHQAIRGFSLGQAIDAEPNGLPHPLALGDDLNNQPDEDGVQIVTPWLTGGKACVNVLLVSGPLGGKLDAWVDLNGSGTWEPAEQVFVAQPLVPGFNGGLCFNIPCNAKLGTNYARFRLTSAGVGALGPTGLAQDGEVEDYLVTIAQPRPTNSIVISKIVVTNMTLGGTDYQVASLTWNAQACVQYQLLAATSLGTNNGSNIVWSPAGPIVLGPNNSQAVTNPASANAQKYYRVVAP